MKNLKKQIERTINERRAKAIEEVNNLNGFDWDDLTWWIRQYVTPSVKKKGFTKIKEAREYFTKRINKDYDKKIAKELKLLEVVENCNIDFKETTIVVQWKPNRTWGSNPTAECFLVGLGELTSGSIGGCGYDKLSTAVANVLNQITPIKKALYAEKNRPKNRGKKNHEIFGYGSGYGDLPNFEGGVGVSCYPEIFKKIGIEFKHTIDKKDLDVFTLKRIK